VTEFRPVSKTLVDTLKAEMMLHYGEGVNHGIEVSIRGLEAARNAATGEQNKDLLPGLDLAIQTLRMALDMAKTGG
jgi:hypothetical protein